MATDHTHGYPADTTDETRPLTIAVSELTTTFLETLTKHIGRRVGPQCVPDGDWMREEDAPLRKTWRRHGGDDRVQLQSTGLTGTWRLEHQTADGRFQVVAAGLEREDAYEAAEKYMADLEEVSRLNRTGRATEE